MNAASGCEHAVERQFRRALVGRFALIVIGLVAAFGSGGLSIAEEAALTAASTTAADTFDPLRRTVLTGAAGRRLVEFLGEGRALGFKPVWPNLAADSREITGAEVDALEAVLLPGYLAAVRQGTRGDVPHAYYRQYAAATYDGEPAIFVNGIHELYFSGTGKHVEDWQRVPIENGGGGHLYWYGVYLQGRHEFVPLQAVNLRHPEHVGAVRFHGVDFFDCHGKDKACEGIL
jgi:hypothetical protein